MATAQHRPQVGHRDPHPLVEVTPVPPHRLPPVAHQDQQCVDAIIAEARERVEYYPHECIGTSVCRGYHLERAAIVTVHQSPPKLVEKRAPDLDVWEVVVAPPNRGSDVLLPRCGNRK